MAKAKVSQAFDVEFTRNGDAFKPEQVAALLAALAQGTTTDLLVLSHGWNNDKHEAEQLYDKLTASLKSRLAVGAYPKLDGRSFTAMRVYWPSKRFADADLIPGGGAAAAGVAPDQALVADIDGLIPLFDGRDGSPPDDDAVQTLQNLRALAPDIEQDEDAQDQYARMLRSLLSDVINEEEEVLEGDFFTLDGPELLQRLGRPFRPRDAAAGGATGLEDAQDDGGAAGLGNLFRGVVNGARNLLNLFTYYEMKERAGLVGSTGVANLLRTIAREHDTLRIHLAGHSFGGRLVSAALATKGDPIKACSVALLQAAFSHWGFAQRYDGQHDGFFRNAVSSDRLVGPMIVTHTKNDRAVGLAYPIASRLRRQVASGIGDEKDPYGGIGRNGAQRSDDVVSLDEKKLLAKGGSYRLTARRVFNLEASDYISGHSEVHGEEVANAMLHAISVVP